MKCPDCDKDIVRIERYHTTVVWEKKNGEWTVGASDIGTHFHVFCPDYDEYDESGKHTMKIFGQDLPEELRNVVYPKAFKK
jgi:hypothetical protein